MNEMTPKQKLEWDTLGDGLCEKATEVLVDVEPIGNLDVSLWCFYNEKGLSGYAIKLKHVDVLSREGAILHHEDIKNLHQGIDSGFQRILKRHNDAVLKNCPDGHLLTGFLPGIAIPDDPEES